MNRRGFLQSILAASTAPYIVKADALMRVYPNTLRIVPYVLPLGVLTMRDLIETKTKDLTQHGQVIQRIVTSYEYNVQAILDLPHNIDRLGLVMADGVDITRYVTVADGVATLNLPLAEFGNRMPPLHAEWWPE
jgi:hypothetical protein